MSDKVAELLEIRLITGSKLMCNCPTRNKPLRIEWRLIAKGPAMVAGVMPKRSATNIPHLVCDACGFVEAGKRKSQK